MTVEAGKHRHGLLAKINAAQYYGELKMKNEKAIIEINGVFSINTKIKPSTQNLDPELKALIDSVLRK